MTPNSEMYNAAMEKLGKLVEQGKAGAANVINHVINNQPQDRIVKVSGTTFEANQDKKVIEVITPDGTRQGLHRNALTQMASTADIPLKFVDSLKDEKEEWGRELLAHNLSEVYHKRFAKKRYLARSVNQEIRGWLSDSYRRLDSRPIVEAFAAEAMKLGANPYQGIVTDTKLSIQALMPKLYEPISGEVVAYGLGLENSDFGNGALSLRVFILRLICTNGAIAEDMMRQVHLGRRLDDNMSYSQRTYELDTQTTVSAIRDIVKGQLSAENLERRVNAVRAAGENEVSPKTAAERLKKMLNKSEAEAAISAFNSPDVLNLPPGNSEWRLSNAISWIAGQTEDQERKLELQRFAGSVLPVAA